LNLCCYFSTALVKSTKSVCDYVLKLFVGIDFPSNCDEICRSIQLDRLTVQENQFNNLSFTFFISNPKSKELSIKYYIQNVALRKLIDFVKLKSNLKISDRSIKYFEEIVFIQSLIENRYISILILDSSAYRTSVSMSTNDKSLFVMKKGLECKDSSSIYVSFLYLSSSNLYLRHENGRIKLSKNDQTSLFKQDATFKLIFDDKNDIVAFQTINLQNYFFLALNNETNTSLIVTQSGQQTTIGKFDDRFIFKIISAR
jgi:hypothetical protein